MRSLRFLPLGELIYGSFLGLVLVAYFVAAVLCVVFVH